MSFHNFCSFYRIEDHEIRHIQEKMKAKEKRKIFDDINVPIYL